MTTYICKCGRRVKKSTDASTTGNRLSGYAPGHECWGCPYAMPYGDFQWDESARTVSRETRGYECRMSKTLTYASEFAGSIKDKCTCRVHSLDFDFLSQVSAWIKDTYPDREIFSSFSKDIRASDYGSDGRYCLTITCTQNLKGVAAKRELLGQFFNPDGSRKDMTPQQEMEKILADIKKAKEILSCAPAQNADAAVTTAENAVPTATAATPTTSESGADASASAPATSLQNCESAPAASAGGSSAPMPSAPGFDFGADDETNALLLQDAQTFITGNMARIMAAKHAHDLTANHYKGSWGKWCAAVGISRDTGDRMVSVAAQCGNIQLEGKSILDVQPLKLLYAAAKPSTPTQVKQAVFSGDITSYKEYQELLAQIKAEKERADAAETREEEARKAAHEYHEKYEEAAAMRATLLDQQGVYIADIDGLKKQNAELQQSYHDADEGRIAARLQCQKAEGERDRAEERAKDAENQLAGSRQMAEAAKLRGDKLKAENDALKKQPITTVVDKEEVERQAREMAAEMTADLRAQLEQAASGSEQDAHSSYDNVLLADRSFQNIGKMVVPALRRLPPEQREQLTNMLVHTLGQIQGEVSRCL